MAQGVAGLRPMLGASKRRRSAHGGAQTYQDSSALRRRRTTAEPGITARLAKREGDAGRTKVHTFDHAKTFLDMKLHVRLRAPPQGPLVLTRVGARGPPCISVVARSVLGVRVRVADTCHDSRCRPSLTHTMRSMRRASLPSCANDLRLSRWSRRKT
eukprot:COSAG02_NODE_2862_length_7877_cov_3.059141_2_plen_157_part_00